MGKKDILTKILAITGTVLVWFPVLLLIFMFVVRAARGHIIHLDFLWLAELFPAVLIGGALLIWAAARARMRLRLIGWSLGIAAGSLVIGQLLAVLTGLATSVDDPSGFWWILVLATIALYSIFVFIIGIGGLLLLGDLFKPVISAAQ